MTGTFLRGALAAAAIAALSTSAFAQGGSSAFPTPQSPVPQNNGTASSPPGMHTDTDGAPMRHYHHHHHHHYHHTAPTDDNTGTPQQ